MRSEADWTRWGDEHPWLAGLIQFGIYALCWVGFICGIWFVGNVLTLIARFLGA